MLQVQDYYVAIRLKDKNQCITMLYRLCLACEMLRNVQVRHRGTAHNYPRFQLAYLLILEHWRVTNYIGLQMMQDNMSCVNEELGEIIFSMLAKVTSGGPTISDFDHMSQMFSLLPVYRDIKMDVHKDLGKKDSINWHHTIKANDENVLMTGVFFRGVIRRVLNNTFRSYNGLPECFANQESGMEHSTDRCLPVVYCDDVMDSVVRQLTGIGRALTTRFVHRYSDLWPGGGNVSEEKRDNVEVDMSVSEDENAEDADLDVDQIWGAPWSQCIPGKIAVARGNFPRDGLGVAVYGIVSINEDEIVDGERWRSFTGIQYDCSIKNTFFECLNGRWRKGLVSFAAEKVWDWEVLAYVDSLLADDKLPERVVQLIESVCERERVFQNQ